jgi:hypothetical protein
MVTKPSCTWHLLQEAIAECTGMEIPHKLLICQTGLPLAGMALIDPDEFPEIAHLKDRHYPLCTAHLSMWGNPINEVWVTSPEGLQVFLEYVGAAFAGEKSPSVVSCSPHYGERALEFMEIVGIAKRYIAPLKSQLN